MQQIKKSKIFQTDLARYSTAIDSMPEGPDRSEANKLLSLLISEVKNMGNMYLDMIYSKQLQSTGNDLREKISSIRKN